MVEREIDATTVTAITQAFEGEQDNLFSRMNVVGIGTGTKVRSGVDTGESCVKILVAHKLPLELVTDRDRVPARVGRYNTDVEEVGELFAGHDGGVDGNGGRGFGSLEGEVSALALTQRIRPAQGGFSVGHHSITAGTFGTAVYDSSPFPGIPPRYYILSNNHVLANSNNARIGDPILQPGPHDGGTMPGDIIAHLSRFVPIRFQAPGSTPVNLVDAAIAEGPFHSLNREIYWIGYVKGVRNNVRVGEILQKTGRTTNYTTGTVTAINATVNVNYGGQVARFARQIVTTNMSAGGDSGSLVLDLNENAVGLLFAGSSAATIINNIAYVQSLLGIRIV